MKTDVDQVDSCKVEGWICCVYGPLLFLGVLISIPHMKNNCIILKEIVQRGLNLTAAACPFTAGKNNVA